MKKRETGSPHLSSKNTLYVQSFVKTNKVDFILQLVQGFCIELYIDNFDDVQVCRDALDKGSILVSRNKQEGLGCNMPFRGNENLVWCGGVQVKFSGQDRVDNDVKGKIVSNDVMGKLDKMGTTALGSWFQHNQTLWQLFETDCSLNWEIVTALMEPRVGPLRVLYEKMSKVRLGRVVRKRKRCEEEEEGRGGPVYLTASSRHLLGQSKETKCTNEVGDVSMYVCGGDHGCLSCRFHHCHPPHIVFDSGFPHLHPPSHESRLPLQGGEKKVVGKKAAPIPVPTLLFMSRHPASSTHHITTVQTLFYSFLHTKPDPYTQTLALQRLFSPVFVRFVLFCSPTPFPQVCLLVWMTEVDPCPWRMHNRLPLP